MIKKATFGAGCFWHVEEVFYKLKGVISTQVGFMGGKLNYKNPTYRLVCTGITKHAEVVEVTYDDKKISYEKLLETFWNNHNPTQKNRQGFDIGTQYRSIIFYYDNNQKKIAENSLKKHQEKLKKKITTKIGKASKFYRAEDYHQKYFQKKKGIFSRLF